MKQTESACLLLLTVLALAGHCPAQNPILAPDLRPDQMLRDAAAKEYFGAVELGEAPLQVQIEAADAAQGLPGLILAPAGPPVSLRAHWDIPDKSPLEAERQARAENRGLFRQTLHVEVQWEGEPDDRLLPASDGSVEWSPGTRDGAASWVTAHVAAMRVDRSASDLASPGDSVPATMYHGRGGVLILPGIIFDRAGDGLLFGQNIGIYPSETSSSAPSVVRDRAALYRPPTDFHRLDSRASAAAVTTWKTLGDFFPPSFPEDSADAARYVAISPRLLQFWAAYEEKLSAAGLLPANLHIVRGFVSPTERLRLERRGIALAEFTRYQYGDAVAVIYGTESGGALTPADADGDGQVTISDIDRLADLAKETMDELGMYGGVGVCGSYEGPGPSAGAAYLHIDLRGWYVPFREE